MPISACPVLFVSDDSMSMQFEAENIEFWLMSLKSLMQKSPAAVHVAIHELC